MTKECKRSKDSNCRKFGRHKTSRKLKKKQLMLFLKGTKKGLKPERERYGGKKKRERKRLGI